VGRTYRKTDSDFEYKRSKCEKRREKIKKKHEFLEEPKSNRDEETKYKR